MCGILTRDELTVRLNTNGFICKGKNSGSSGGQTAGRKPRYYSSILWRLSWRGVVLDPFQIHPQSSPTSWLTNDQKGGGEIDINLINWQLESMFSPVRALKLFRGVETHLNIFPSSDRSFQCSLSFRYCFFFFFFAGVNHDRD